MDISRFDSNFKPNFLTDCNVEIEWRAIEEDVFSLHGVFYSQEDGLYLRMPLDVAKQVSANVEYLCTNTAGGRIRFRTDSKMIAYQVIEPNCVAMPHMPLTGQMGFALYCDDKYEGTFSPSAKDLENENVEFSGFHYTIYPKAQGQFYDYDLYFPLYNGVKKIYIGVIKGSKFETPRQYKNKSPIVYYGSSITQGGCAGHPGNDYQGHIARAIDYDYLNLGFSGSAKGEIAMANYITTIPHSAFVMDYDHNAQDYEHLEKTHYAFYKAYREKCKDTPIIFVTKPDYWTDPIEPKRIELIRRTYKKALAEGDKNVYFVNGKTFFGKDLYSCTIDSCHPNDLGFWKITNKLLPVIKKALLGDK